MAAFGADLARVRLDALGLASSMLDMAFSKTNSLYG